MLKLITVKHFVLSIHRYLAIHYFINLTIVIEHNMHIRQLGISHYYILFLEILICKQYLTQDFQRPIS